MILAVLGYLVAVSCIATYVYAASGRSLTPNLWANMLGGPIVAFGNALVGYWPAVILEVFFTGAGAYGLARLWWQRRNAWNFKIVWFPTLRNVDNLRCNEPMPHSHNGIAPCGNRDYENW